MVPGLLAHSEERRRNKKNPAVLEFAARVASSIGFQLHAVAAIGVPRALIARPLPDFTQLLQAL